MRVMALTRVWLLGALLWALSGCGRSDPYTPPPDMADADMDANDAGASDAGMDAASDAAEE